MSLILYWVEIAGKKIAVNFKHPYIESPPIDSLKF